MTALQSNLLEIHTPQGREEAWRFTPLKRLAGMHDGTAVTSLLDSLKQTGALPSGVSFEKVEAEAFTASNDAIVQRIRAFSGSVQRLTVSQNTEINEPIHFSRSLRDLQSVEFARVQIVLEPNSKATVIFENSGDLRLGEDLEIRVGAGAHLTFISLQEWGASSVHAAHHHAVVERDGTFNRNLLLSDGARADSVPNLEIETGEIVGAGHASTTGRFDDEQLFYLMSRGISSADARRLVVRGFFTEIVSQIKDQVIEDRIMARIDDELAKAGAING